MLKIFKGTIINPKSFWETEVLERGYIVTENGRITEVLSVLPEKYKNQKVTDFGDSLILPGFCDLHLHASQFYQRGIGMDVMLLDWLETYTFPQESNFQSMEYATKAYDAFTEELIRHGTLHASIFATVHEQATSYLLKLLNDKKISALVGKVNMDRNCPDFIREDTQKSKEETERFILQNKDFTYAKPIITPRFVPSCTDELMEQLGKIAEKYAVPVQSHLCESHAEIAFIKNLYPKSSNYTEIYKNHGLMPHGRTIMAHCIYLSEDEINLMIETETIAVHCPDSNINVSSGIMPVLELEARGVNLALGSDIGGGHNLPMYKCMAKAIQSSKIYAMHQGEQGCLTIENALYMATRAGEKIFQNTGAMEKGYRFNAIVLDDSQIPSLEISPLQRLERFCYIGDDRQIAARFVDAEILK